MKFLIKSDNCHRGFRNNAWSSPAKLVYNYEGLDKRRKLVITGHSLGVATETLIADLNNQNITLITATSPRPEGSKLKDTL